MNVKNPFENTIYENLGKEEEKFAAKTEYFFTNRIFFRLKI